MNRPAVILWLGALAGLPGCSLNPSSGMVPINWSPCPRPTAPDARCAAVWIPPRHDPAIPGASLHVMVVPRTGGDPKTAVVFFAGGPGQRATEDGPPFLASIMARLRERFDVVLVDLRGTELTAPECSWSDDASTIAGVFRVAFAPAGVHRCRSAIDPSLPATLRTEVFADDVAAVLDRLEYTSVSLIGASYGTRLALVFLRRHAGSVNQVVLNSTVPVNFAMPLSFARDAQATLDSVFALCGRDAGCGKAFPALNDDFARLMRRLAVRPDTFQGVPVTRDAFAARLRELLYVTPTRMQVPRVLASAATGDYGPLASAVLTPAGESRVGMPIFLSVTCSEDIPLLLDLQRRAPLARLVEHTFLGDSRIRQQTGACDEWPVPPVPRAFYQRVRSGKPTLFISGALDPVTPPQWAESVRKGFPHSRHLVPVSAGHVPQSACVDSVMVSFLVRSVDVASLDVTCGARPTTRTFLIPADRLRSRTLR